MLLFTKVPELTLSKHSAPALSTDPLKPLAAELLPFVFFGEEGTVLAVCVAEILTCVALTPQVRSVDLKFTGRMSPLRQWW